VQAPKGTIPTRQGQFTGACCSKYIRGVSGQREDGSSQRERSVQVGVGVIHIDFEGYFCLGQFGCMLSGLISQIPLDHGRLQQRASP